MVEIDEKQIFIIVQKAKETGSIKIGANEVTKAIERGIAKLVLSATDVSPAEIVAHFGGLCKELKVPYFSIGNKSELGALVGIKSTTSIVVLDAGSSKKELEVMAKEIFAKPKEVKEEAKVEEKKVEEVKTETKKEAKVETKKEAVEVKEKEVETKEKVVKTKKEAVEVAEK